MTVEKQLFAAMDQHLLEDATPSDYFQAASRLPEFQEYPFNLLLALKKADQEPTHHPEGNVWNHTMLVVDQAASRRDQSSQPRAFMWAALLHDIGKPAATKRIRGKLTAYDHDKIGEKLSRQFLLTLDAPEAFIQQVADLVRFHMHVLYAAKNMPYGDMQALKSHTDPQEVALLGLCDRLGRTNADQALEEQNIALFLSKLMNKK
ncbi:HDIG domain-containing protein [Aminipila butyrica]|uniref:HDIG domain-containing protein n=1 Tax=Aminipila butyrica TaxID=433296 RepID=A0A858BWU6_9FIRM|nr:HDIG domain-containing metalloprotein [Aminipila butyrica]QIB69194.1 HDIG domain-containing protein [Aminipila butyrica]